MKKCECGEEVRFDGYDNIEIEDGCLCIKGKAYCECGKVYEYEELHVVDFNKPFGTYLEDITEEYNSK